MSPCYITVVYQGTLVVQTQDGSVTYDMNILHLSLDLTIGNYVQVRKMVENKEKSFIIIRKENVTKQICPL